VLLGVALALAGAAVLVLIALNRLAGPAALDLLPEEAVPPPPEVEEGAPPGVAVVTACPGMPAPLVEKTITDRLERWLGQPNTVLRSESRSLAGVSVLRIAYRGGVTPAEAVETAESLVRAALPTLPPEVRPPRVFPWDSVRILLLGFVTLEDATRSESELRAQARAMVHPSLAAVHGAIVPGPLGGTDRVIAVRIDSRKLEDRGLLLPDVIAALRRQHWTILPGPTIGARETILLDAAGLPEPDKLARTVLGEKRTVLLRDVAVAEDALLPTGVRLRLDGRPVLCMPIYRHSVDDPLTVRDGVLLAVGELTKKLPASTRLAFWPANGCLTLAIRIPAGTSPGAAEKRFAEVEQVVGEVIPKAQRAAVLTLQGVAADWSALMTPNAGPQDALIRVLLPPKQLTLAPGILRRLRRRLTEEPSFADLQTTLAAGSSVVELDSLPCTLILRLPASELEQGTRAAEVVRRHLGELPGAVDVAVVERQNVPYLVLEADRQKAADIGRTPADVLAGAAAELGLPHGSGGTLWVEERGGRLSSLTLPAWSMPELGKLSNLLMLRRTQAAEQIHHANGRRVLHVRANVENRDPKAFLADVEKALAAMHLPPGLQVEVLGGSQP
jgi:multidrug efflux pump subunit AcrB